METSFEQRILSAIIKDRSAYETFQRCGDAATFTAIGRHVSEDVGRYYDADDSARCCDRGSLIDRAGRLPNPKHGEAIQRLIGGLPEDVSAANVILDLREHRIGFVSDKLALALANRSPEAADLTAEYQNALLETGSSRRESDALVLHGADVSDLTSETPPGQGLIKLWPKPLNDLCDGGAKRGHQILLFGRPESGKTLVTINLVAGFLKQGLHVMYFCNEEPATDIRARIRQRILCVSKHALIENRLALAEKLSRLSSGGSGTTPLGRWSVIGLSPGTIPEIRKLVNEFKPDVVVLDQLRNIRVSSATRVEELESVATEARNLGKWSDVLVVSVTQAGASADGKAVLDLMDVDGSKTGIPAQMDLMIGVGNIKTAWDQGVLTLTACKNKLSGRHESIQVSVNKATGQIT